MSVEPEDKVLVRRAAMEAGRQNLIKEDRDQKSVSLLISDFDVSFVQTVRKMTNLCSLICSLNCLSFFVFSSGRKM